jgi:hypothetical protein
MLPLRILASRRAADISGGDSSHDPAGRSVSGYLSGQGFGTGTSGPSARQSA